MLPQAKAAFCVSLNLQSTLGHAYVIHLACGADIAAAHPAVRRAVRAVAAAQAAAGRQLGVRRHIPPALFLIGLTILIIALARPQMVVSVPRVEGTVILAFDVSGSMAADDLKPTRMDAAKAAALDFIQKQPSTVQIGVVAFSDGGFA